MTGTQTMPWGAVAAGALLFVGMLVATAALLMLLVRRQMKLRPGFWRSFAVVVPLAIAIGVFDYLLRSIGLPHWAGDAIAYGCGIVPAMLCVWVVVRCPDGRPMGWKKTALIASDCVLAVWVLSSPALIRHGIALSAQHLHWVTVSHLPQMPRS